MERIIKLGFGGRHGQERVSQADSYPGGLAEGQAEPQEGLLFPILPCTAVSPTGYGAGMEGNRLGEAVVAIPLGRKDNRAVTSFPSQVLIFLNHGRFGVGKPGPGRSP